MCQSPSVGHWVGPFSSERAQPCSAFVWLDTGHRHGHAPPLTVSPMQVGPPHHTTQLSRGRTLGVRALAAPLVPVHALYFPSCCTLSSGLAEGGCKTHAHTLCGWGEVPGALLWLGQ